MALLQISEPQAKQKKHAIVVGIDLGTTQTLVATVENAQAKVITDLIPSVVHFGHNTHLVGKEAEIYITKDTNNTIWSSKRIIGKNHSDVQHTHPSIIKKNNRLVFATTYGDKSPEEIAGHILHYAAEQASKQLPQKPQAAVITVPAYFDESQRQCTNQAAQLAGIKVLRLLNEPTAAALAYGLHNNQENITLVYDLGGGTFDISILKQSQGIFRVLAISGDTALGGDDIDNAIVDELNVLYPNTIAANEIRLRAKMLKEQLSQNIQNDDGISQERLQQLTKPIIDKTFVYVEQALADAKLNKQDIDNIILVGGSTKMPYIKTVVGEYFAKEPLVSIDPEHVVAIGAAIQANTLSGQNSNSTIILDVVPLSLGIETIGGLFEKIIPRNTSIPIAKAQEFTTSEDNQTSLKISVYQGERELIQDNRKLGDFTVREIPAMGAGLARVLIQFTVDSDGLLTVSATEKITGKVTSIEFHPTYGLKPEVISDMLKQSIDFAKIDMSKRALSEAKISAKSIVQLVQEAIVTDGDLLEESEKKQITHNIQQLQRSIETSQNPADIEQAKTLLIKATDGFAAKRMDRTVKNALQGKEINNV